MYFSPRSARCAALALFLCATAFLPACAQNSASATLAPAPSSQRPVRTISQISVSPDGKRLAWIESAEIHVAPLGSSRQEPARHRRALARRLLHGVRSRLVARLGRRSLLLRLRRPRRPSRPLSLASRRQSAPASFPAPRLRQCAGLFARRQAHRLPLCRGRYPSHRSPRRHGRAFRRHRRRSH